MKQVTLHITNKKYPVFLEFLKTLNYVKKVEEEIEEREPTKEEILNGIREAVEEVKLIKAGKLKGIPAKELLNEL